MNHQDTTSLTLFDLLARTWATDAPINSVLLNSRQTAVGFALKNGTVAIAPTADEDAPQDRIHVSAENGRSTIKPRSKPIEPLKIIEVAAGEDLLFGTIGGEDFVAGSAGGPLFRIRPDGDKSPINLELDANVSAIDHCAANGQFAAVNGTRVTVFDAETVTPAWRLDHGEPITALAFAPNCNSIAIAHDHGLTIWPLIDVPSKTIDIAFNGRPTALSWSPDGNWIACPLSDGGFQLSCLKDGATNALTDYPSSVGLIVWNEPANALVTSGAFRITAWSMDSAPITDAAKGVLETGRAGLVPISAIASHPSRNLVVAGYENGYLAIAQIGARDELVLNAQDNGAVTNLALSRDGRSLALAARRNHAAVVTLPPQMFK